MKAIELNHLSKVFSTGKAAVNQIKASIEPGEIYGLLGPNGAGKTTTVKLLTGILEASEGSCQVFGIDPFEKPQEVHKIAGILTEHAQMYDLLSGIENLVFYGQVFGLTKEESSQKAYVLMEQLGLQEAQEQKLGTYSTGMRQRLSLARAMIHQPKILFLDEPTSGLDPENVLHVNRMIKELASNQGVTVFLCTHQLRYAEEICDKYGLMDNGSLLASGTIEELRKKVSTGLTLTIQTDKMPESLKGKQIDEMGYELCIQSEEEIPDIVETIVQNRGKVYGVHAKKLTLEEIYFALIEQQERREEGC